MPENTGRAIAAKASGEIEISSGHMRVGRRIEKGSETVAFTMTEQSPELESRSGMQ